MGQAGDWNTHLCIFVTLGMNNMIPYGMISLLIYLKKSDAWFVAEIWI